MAAIRRYPNLGCFTASRCTSVSTLPMGNCNAFLAPGRDFRVKRGSPRTPHLRGSGLPSSVHKLLEIRLSRVTSAPPSSAAILLFKCAYAFDPHIRHVVELARQNCGVASLIACAGIPGTGSARSKHLLALAEFGNDLILRMSFYASCREPFWVIWDPLTLTRTCSDFHGHIDRPNCCHAE